MDGARVVGIHVNGNAILFVMNEYGVSEGVRECVGVINASASSTNSTWIPISIAHPNNANTCDSIGLYFTWFATLPCDATRANSKQQGWPTRIEILVYAFVFLVDMATAYVIVSSVIAFAEFNAPNPTYRGIFPTQL